MTGLTSVGKSGTNTTVNGPVVASEGVTGNLTGNVTGNLTGDVTGNVSGSAASIAGVTSTAAELNIMDGSATDQETVTLVGADGFVISDGDVMKQALISDIATYVNASSGNSIDGLSDAKSEGDNFTGSMILGHQTTGTLDAAEYNTAVGLTALDAITSGDENIAIGYNALTAATTASDNVAIGSQALYSLSSTGLSLIHI